MIEAGVDVGGGGQNQKSEELIELVWCDVFVEGYWQTYENKQSLMHTVIILARNQHLTTARAS